MKSILPILFLSCCLSSAWAGKVDTVNIFSNSMHKDIRCVVIKPDRYKKKKLQFPVVYLLHGFTGDYANWIRRVPELKDYADEFQLIIVCPDGGFSSWYFDSPVDSTIRYETYVSTELISYIDSHYRTIADKAHRAITGLSMGGHGGLFLGFRHTDTFGAIGSMSGGLDINSIRNSYDLSLRIGDTISHATEWHDLSVINLAEKYMPAGQAIIIDCGTDDIFIDANRRTHQQLLRRRIPHEYIERPGVHNWDYWRKSVRYQFFFFRNFFGGQKLATQ